MKAIVEFTDGAVNEYYGDEAGLKSIVEGLKHVKGYELVPTSANEGELRWPLTPKEASH